MSDIIIRNLSKSFGDKRVLEGFDLTVPDGGICCIMGESGCGKSTLIKLIMGIYAPDGGEIAGVAAIYRAVDQVEGHPVRSIFSVKDLPDYQSYESKDCPFCKKGRRIDALINSHGYSLL